MNDLADKWLWRELPKEAADSKLFCFHHAGGSSVFYRGWNDYFKNVEVNAVQLPGRWTRAEEPAVTDMKTLIDIMYDNLKMQFQGNYSFFGYSLGGLIAFELIRKIESEGGQAPQHLFVSSCASPDIKREDKIYDLPVNKFLDKLESDYGSLPAGLRDNSDVQEMILPSLRSDMQLLETYNCTDINQIKVPITVFAGSDDRQADPGKIARWKKFSVAPFSSKILNGGHFLSKEEIAKMASDIRSKVEPN